MGKFNDSCCFNEATTNKSDYTTFQNIGTTPYCFTLPFNDVNELHVQGKGEFNSRLIIEYTTTNNATTQKLIFYISGTIEVQLPKEKGFFTNVCIYSLGGAILQGHINFINK